MFVYNKGFLVRMQVTTKVLWFNVWYQDTMYHPNPFAPIGVMVKVPFKNNFFDQKRKK